MKYNQLIYFTINRYKNQSFQFYSPTFFFKTFILVMKGVDNLKKVLIKIYVSPETKIKIKTVAKQKKKSQSTVVRHWVEDYLDTLVFPEDEERGS